jgi:hypothetical protein
MMERSDDNGHVRSPHVSGMNLLGGGPVGVRDPVEIDGIGRGIWIYVDNPIAEVLI